MALFDTREHYFADEIHSGSRHIPSVNQILRVSGRYQSMHSALGEITPDCTIHFITSGAWSMHDLLVYVLRYTGPADVRCFTFSWGPDASRTIIQLREAGAIRKLWLLSHTVMKKWNSTSIAIMSKYCEKVTLLPNHAKGFLVENDAWHVSVLGSANFSNNQSIEGGVLTTNREVYDLHREWLDLAFQTGDLFLGDAREEVYAETPAVEVNEHKLFLIRGLPGSGKTALAHAIAEEVYEENDHFSFGGKYRFDIKHVDKAIEECFFHCQNAMERGVKRIAIANTFVEEELLKPYYKLARTFGYSVFCLVAENRHGGTNIHNVEARDIERMRRKFRVKLC